MDLILELLISRNNSKNFDIYNIENQFNLPIELIDKKIELNKNINIDLELSEFKDNIDISSNEIDISNNIYKENLYYSVLQPNNNLDRCLASKWSKYYTNDKEYLNETQILLKNFKKTVFFEDENILNEKVFNISEDIIRDNGFIDKYQYINLPYFNKYNNNENVMQCLSIYNLANPLISILLPVILLLLPFFIIKIQGHNITINSYLEHLKKVFSNHIIGQFFTDFYDAPISTKIYLLVSIVFYIFQVYQNVVSCSKFYKNINYIINKLLELRDYINNSINNFRNLLKYTENLITYKKFNDNLIEKINILNKFLLKLNKIREYNIKTTFLQLGDLMVYFYELYNNNSIISSLYYSYGCNSYIENIINIQKHIKNKNMNFCRFIDNNNKTSFKNSYFGKLLNNKDIDTKIVKNDYKLNNNLILTGPNAAGKTTLLKSTLFNIILSQQIGCGFYDKANLKIYDYIHCYINIPDTSGRDSLFQAEARRCKEIIECIKENSNKNHFCVFDELYSGTNPEEAISSASGLLNYLNEKNNVNYILTTHYYKLCKNIDKKFAKNFHMEIINTDKDHEFTYKIKKGISKIKGGLKVLKDLEYPDDIINYVKNN